MRTELIGRKRDLATLTDWLDAALGGNPRVGLCRGEPGIGKAATGQR